MVKVVLYCKHEFALDITSNCYSFMLFNDKCKHTLQAEHYTTFEHKYLMSGKIPCTSNSKKASQQAGSYSQ